MTTNEDVREAPADMIEGTEQPSARVQPQTVRRVVLDFIAGCAIFCLVAACVGIADGQAAPATDAAGWVTTVSYAADHAGGLPVPDRQMVSVLLLAMTFGGLTALNLSLARHLRVAAMPTRPTAADVQAKQG
jgi:hypothetical protein